MKLRKVIIASTSMILLAAATGQTSAPSIVAPHFEDFPVSTSLASRKTEAFIDRPHPPETVAEFDRRVQAAATEGPDFAGSYVIVSWHCGSGCIEMVIVDVKSLRVLTKPFATIGLWLPSRDERQLTYRLNSALLVIDGFLDTPTNRPDYGKRFYVWDRHQLKLLFTAVDRPFSERIQSMAIRKR